MRLASIIFLLLTLCCVVEFGNTRNIPKRNGRELSRIPEFRIIGRIGPNGQRIPFVVMKAPQHPPIGRANKPEHRRKRPLNGEKKKRKKKRKNKLEVQPEKPGSRHQATFVDPQQVKAVKSQANFRGRGRGGEVKKGKKTQSKGKDKEKKKKKKKEKKKKSKKVKNKKPKGKMESTQPSEIGRTTIFQPPTMPLLTRPTRSIRFAPINKRPGVMKSPPRFSFQDDYNFDA